MLDASTLTDRGRRRDAGADARPRRAARRAPGARSRRCSWSSTSRSTRSRSPRRSDCPSRGVRELLAELVAEYDAAGRGFELRQVAGGWRIYSRAEYAPVVERFVLDGQTARLTQAALETLAIVAYRQPVSRARVGAVRGVNVDARDAHAGQPRTGRGGRRTTRRPGRCCTGRRPTSCSGSGCARLDELPALAPYLPEVDALDELGAGGAA